MVLPTPPPSASWQARGKIRRRFPVPPRRRERRRSCLSSRCPRDSFTYLTGDGLRLTATWVLDETTNDLGRASMRDGDVIFVKTDRLREFAAFVDSGNITTRFVLVSHNSDLSPPEATHRLLRNPLLAGWFAQNANHPAMTAIPIGIANRRFSVGDVGLINAAAARARARARQGGRHRAAHRHRIFAAFSTGLAASRETLREALRSIPGVKMPSGRMPFDEYLDTMSRSMFTVSPRGHGADSHRTWEALIMGSTPILLASEAAEIASIVAREPESFCVLPRLTPEAVASCGGGGGDAESTEERPASRLPYHDYWWDEISAVAENARDGARVGTKRRRMRVDAWPDSD